jgi:hypothetical protein
MTDCYSNSPLHMWRLVLTHRQILQRTVATDCHINSGQSTSTSKNSTKSQPNSKYFRAWIRGPGGFDSQISRKSHATVSLNKLFCSHISFSMTCTWSIRFNFTLPGVSGDVLCLGKEIFSLVPPHSVWRGTGNWLECYRVLQFREFACNGALYD